MENIDCIKITMCTVGDIISHVCYFVSQSLLETHDSVASQACDSPPPSPCDFVDHEAEDGHTPSLHLPPDAIRMVGLRKVAGEHLVKHKLTQHNIAEFM